MSNTEKQRSAAIIESDHYKCLIGPFLNTIGRGLTFNDTILRDVPEAKLATSGLQPSQLKKAIPLGETPTCGKTGK